MKPSAGAQRCRVPARFPAVKCTLWGLEEHFLAALSLSKHSLAQWLAFFPQVLALFTESVNRFCELCKWEEQQEEKSIPSSRFRGDSGEQ